MGVSVQQQLQANHNSFKNILHKYRHGLYAIAMVIIIIMEVTNLTSIISQQQSGANSTNFKSSSVLASCENNEWLDDEYRVSLCRTSEDDVIVDLRQFHHHPQGQRPVQISGVSLSSQQWKRLMNLSSLIGRYIYQHRRREPLEEAKNQTLLPLQGSL